MLHKPTQAERIAALLDQYTVLVRRAFLSAVDEIRSRVVLALVVTRLEKSDVRGAVDALGLERAPFNPMLDRIGDAYTAGGSDLAYNLPLRSPEGHRTVFRFDARNLVAEQWIRTHSSQLITAILDDQRAAVRTVLEQGLARGQNPRQTALDIVGRLARPPGSRTGGLIGLSAQQGQFVSAARQELVSGDPALLRNYLARTLRDRRFDGTVRKAIEAGAPLSHDAVTKIAGRYADNLLRLRGETIARTETLAALNAGADAAMQQAIDAGRVRSSTVTDVWHTHMDGRERDTHAAMNGQVVPHNQGFRSPSGAVLRYPGDPLAPPAETINCRCWREMKIDFLAGIR